MVTTAAEAGEGALTGVGGAGGVVGGGATTVNGNTAVVKPAERADAAEAASVSEATTWYWPAWTVYVMFAPLRVGAMDCDVAASCNVSDRHVLLAGA